MPVASRPQYPNPQPHGVVMPQAPPVPVNSLPVKGLKKGQKKRGQK
jgi:hypothetical protein